MASKSNKGDKSLSVSILENKQLLHIAGEVVVLIGVVFYFSSKNKKLSAHIEELAQRIEDQEERIQKLELSIQQMSTAFNSVIQKVQENSAVIANLGSNTDTQKPDVSVKPVVKQPVRQRQQPARAVVTPTPIQVTSRKPKKHVEPVVEEIQVNQKTPQRVAKVQFEEESDSDLDDEIRDELNELLEDETDLKKQK